MDDKKFDIDVPYNAVELDILSQSGSECKLINPWPEEKVTIFRNGRKKEVLSGNTLRFSTKINELIAVAPNIK
jgi:hypothetical protein